MGDNFIVLIVIAALIGLFAFRLLKNKKLYDLLVLLVLVLVGVTKLSIGEKIPQSLVITTILGIGVVIILLFMKDKAEAMKKESESEENKK